MKKFTALLLVVILSLCLAACSGSNDSQQNTKSINVTSRAVGTWVGTSFYGDFMLVLNKNKTGTLTQDGSTESVTWFVDEATRLVIITMIEADYDYKQAFTYLESTDALYHHEIYCTRAE